MPYMSVDTDVHFEVYCKKCGTGLCSRTHVSGHKIEIEPCPKCCVEEKKQNTLIALVEGLYKRLSLDYDYYPSIPEIKRLNDAGVKI